MTNNKNMNRLQQIRRNDIGYVYKPHVNNNIATTNYLGRQSFKQKVDEPTVPYKSGDDNMEGEGFKDVLKSIYEKGKAGAKFLFANKDKIADAYSGQTGTMIRNLIPSSDDTARAGFPGEKHAILKLPNGSYGVANYMGPGTNLIKRLQRGDPPRTETDKVAMGHDIRYGLAKTQDDIRKADNIMLTKVSEIARNRGDAPQNIAQARLIKAKVLGEDLGLLRKDAFSGDLSSNNDVPENERALMMSKLAGLSQAGYGLNPAGGGVLPGDALKLKLLKQLAKKKMKGKGKPNMKKYKLLGSGLTLPGGGKGAVTDFVSSKVIPSIMKAVGIPKGTIPVEQLSTIVGKSLDMAKSGNLPSVISHLAKTILPIITHAKVTSMSGKGRMLQGRSLQGRSGVAGRSLQGRGVMEVLGKHKDMLLEKLGKGLFGAFKKYINHGAKERGLQPLFSGSGVQKGGSFWEDFKKGFSMVFKPFAKIAAPIASALGVPEIGVPLGVVGDAL